LGLPYVPYRDPPPIARAIDVREVYSELLGYAKRGLRGVVLVGPSMLTALAELAHLPRRGEPELPRLVGGGKTNLARDRLRNVLGEPSRGGPSGHPAAGLPIDLTLVRAAALGCAPSSLLGATKGTGRDLPDLSDALTKTADGLPSALA
jgi:hypothetical protein